MRWDFCSLSSNHNTIRKKDLKDVDMAVWYFVRIKLWIFAAAAASNPTTVSFSKPTHVKVLRHPLPHHLPLIRQSQRKCYETPHKVKTLFWMRRLFDFESMEQDTVPLREKIRVKFCHARRRMRRYPTYLSSGAGEKEKVLRIGFSFSDMTFPTTHFLTPLSHEDGISWLPSSDFIANSFLMITSTKV